MAFCLDLLEQAVTLASLDSRRPKQANLKRGVSAAYYALFHLLLDDATQLMISGKEQKPLRDVLRRAFQHGDMRQVAEQFAAGKTPEKLKAVLVAPPSSDLQFVSKTFIDLQQARHEADYAVFEPITRSDALTLIRRAEQAIHRWSQVRNTPEGKSFLVSLLVLRNIRN